MAIAQTAVATQAIGAQGAFGEALVPELPVVQTPLQAPRRSLSLEGDEALADWNPRIHTRRAPILVRINRILRTVLIACSGLALLGYGLDVALSAEVSKLQEQARRLSEQNTELSAQLLKAISFQGIQASVVGRAGLRVPERVIIVKEVKSQPTKPFKSRKHYLPLMSGY